ncbi:hypothetical protein [Arthrobacter zhaoxinii]|uniref:hypothetical protein n=1 Tax=Arthrobacter zhaoxinii TaxID=2964616 RepID=UPI002106CA3D|nr:hypothetical protein [Arthrobacter zhaoxinii]MCQ2001019.1 hypothetical protein [Arthrobacter zhaoxinii]
MKNSLAAMALLTIILTGCSANDETTAQGMEAPTVSPASEPSPSQVEPASLEEAIATAKKEYGTSLETMSALADVRRFAEKQLQPVMPTEEWNDIMVFEIRTEMDMLGERSTDREFSVATQKYAVMVEEAALDAGLIH